jgi:feruloyl esterase
LNIRTTIRPLVLMLAAALAACTVPPSGPSPQASRPAVPSMDCEALARVVSDASTVTAAMRVAPGNKVANLDVDTAMCRVQGVARPSADSEIKFEVWLPATAQAWTGRFKLNGTGGYAGAVPYARLVQDIGDGFVTAGSNMGHDGGEAASWTLNHPEKVRDWGLRAHYYVATAAKALAHAYYGSPVRHAYFEGCSNGGRQAMMMAQRYPELFDGIAAGAPSQFYPEILTWLAYSGKVLTPVQGQPAVLSAAKRKMLSEATHATCDGQDGLADGQITNPKACRFNVDIMRCPGGDAPSCLTGPELTAARAMYGGLRSSTGVQRYAGVMPGSEAEWDPAFGDNGRYGPFIGHYVYSRTSPPYDWRRDLNWDDHFDHIKAFISPVTAAPSPDLSAFKARGGKLIQFHGWADPIVPPTGSPAYYNALIQFERLKGLPRPDYNAAVERLSAQQITSDSLALSGSIRSYHRLFMLPDVGHCRSGSGPAAIGGGFAEPAKAQRRPETHVVSALTQWVERGVSPEVIVATRYDERGSITRQRPICAYPQVAAFRGGDVNSAASFSCATPGIDQFATDATDLLMIRNSLRQRDLLSPRR